MPWEPNRAWTPAVEKASQKGKQKPDQECHQEKLQGMEARRGFKEDSEMIRVVI
jgi:hypothetical protein